MLERVNTKILSMDRESIWYMISMTSIICMLIQSTTGAYIYQNLAPHLFIPQWAHILPLCLINVPPGGHFCLNEKISMIVSDHDFIWDFGIMDQCILTLCASASVTISLIKSVLSGCCIASLNLNTSLFSKTEAKKEDSFHSADCCTVYIVAQFFRICAGMWSCMS